MARERGLLSFWTASEMTSAPRRRLMRKGIWVGLASTLFLIPGFGAQGGTAKDCAAAFDERGLGGIVNNSRGIIFAHSRVEYRDKFGDARWQEAVEAATKEMIVQLRGETTAGQL